MDKYKEDEATAAVPLQAELPHEALFFALSYLPLYELLIMSEVCRSFRDALDDDVLPWLNIVVGKPFNKRFRDDHLLKVASKANRRLRTLALLNCSKITDDGLQQVVACNPNISKLYVPGCTALTPGGVIKAVTLLTRSEHRLKSLRINGIYNIKREDLEILHNLIDENQTKQKQGLNLYHEFKRFTTFNLQETSPSIDMDLCRKCNEVRVVFDCPRDSCKRMRQQQQEVECRGCRYCIPRCEECGTCIKDEETEEAACAESLCLSCWLQLPKCSFCNKPYCTEHAEQLCFLQDCSGFVCTGCHAKFLENS